MRILPHDFSIYMQRQRERLDYTFSIKKIDNIGHQHKAFCDLYRRLTDLKISIDIFDEGAAYLDPWNRLHNTYPLLGRFVGGLATIFPGTSTVESNFFVGKVREKQEPHEFE